MNTGREPLSGASLGSTGSHHSNPHLNDDEIQWYKAMVHYGLDRTLVYTALIDVRGNERLERALKESFRGLVARLSGGAGLASVGGRQS